MIQLEQWFTGHPQIANKMLAHFPSKTNKQIRHKRNERTYKNILKGQVDTENTANTATGNIDTNEDNNNADPPKPKIHEIHEPNMDIMEIETEAEQSTSSTNINNNSHWIKLIIGQALSECPQDVTYEGDYGIFLE
jgi:hypothetical protein